MQNLFDFQCLVYPKVDVRRVVLSRDPVDHRLGEIPVRIFFNGKPRLVRPQKEAWDFGAGLLLQLDMPKASAIAKDVRRESEDSYKIDGRRLTKLRDLPDPNFAIEDHELNSAKRKIIGIAKRFGPMRASLFSGDAAMQAELLRDGEPIDGWLRTADLLRKQFGLERRFASDDRTEVEVGNLGLFMSRTGDKIKISVRPSDLREAFLYWATLRLGQGVTVRACQWCSHPMMRGGGSGKKADSRFCSDPCRFKFNNERRRRKGTKKGRTVAHAAPP